MIIPREPVVPDGSLGTPAGTPGPKASADRAFDGAGEMGALMRSIDWSKTALGPVTGWSQALKTTVGILLSSPSAMYLTWGPQLVQLYNDAYQPIMGAKHPEVMGQEAKESWAEVWHLVEPLTGYGGPVVTAKAEEAGFNLQITKPVEGSELAKLVSNARA